MLLQNPQLAYALLQAQIVMKIVDPQVAMVRSYYEPYVYRFKSAELHRFHILYTSYGCTSL